MATGVPCYCINPDCTARENVYSRQQLHCHHCGTALMIQPQQFLLSKPLYGLTEIGNSEVFEITDFQFTATTEHYPKIVKILKPNATAIALKLFQQEANILQELKDFAVPRSPIQAYFKYRLTAGKKTQDLHCLIMEQVTGETLENFIQRQGTITTEIALDWLRQLAQLLLDIHRKGIIHRDIKPSNIMVTQTEDFPYGKLTLIDFGTARRHSRTYINKLFNQTPLTKIISYGYTAPEQQQGQCTFKSDLYSLGCTLIYALTGFSPDTLAAENRPWQELVKQPWLRYTIQQLTLENPHKRLPSAKQLLDHLSQFLKYPTPTPLQYFALLSPWHYQRAAIALGASSLFLLVFSPAKQLIAESLVTQAEQVYQSQPDQAMRLYTVALLFNQKHDLAHFGKGFLCDQSQNIACAEKHYVNAIKYNSIKDSIPHFFGTNNYALLQIKQAKNIDQAIAALKDILPTAQAMKREDIIYKNLGWAYLLKSDADQAELYLQKASKTLADNGEFQCLNQALEKAKTTEDFSSVANCTPIN